jgi:hypothetical protein
MDGNWWVQDAARQRREQFMAEAQQERAAETANTAQNSWLNRLSGWLGNLGTDHVVVDRANTTQKAKANASR